MVAVGWRLPLPEGLPIMADVHPAPKPSQKANTGGPPAKDDAVTGEIVLSKDGLKEDAARRKALLDSPDGTFGKDVAERAQAELDRDKRAAPIITAAVKDAKAWDELHGKAAKVTKSLADKLVKLRAIYVDKDGRPDMRGTSLEYREAASKIYERAGFDTGKAALVQGAVRYHVSESVRAALRGPEFADGDEGEYLKLCEYYRLNPESAAVRQKNRRSVEGATRLPALTLPPDDTSAIWQGAVQYAHKALEAPGDADVTSLPEDERRALRRELEAIQERATTVLDELIELDGPDDA